MENGSKEGNMDVVLTFLPMETLIMESIRRGNRMDRVFTSGHLEVAMKGYFWKD